MNKQHQKIHVRLLNIGFQRKSNCKALLSYDKFRATGKSTIDKDYNTLTPCDSRFEPYLPKLRYVFVGKWRLLNNKINWSYVTSGHSLPSFGKLYEILMNYLGLHWTNVSIRVVKVVKALHRIGHDSNSIQAEYFLGFLSTKMHWITVMVHNLLNGR